MAIENEWTRKIDEQKDKIIDLESRAKELNEIIGGLRNYIDILKREMEAQEEIIDSL